VARSELAVLAARKGVELRYEAAVGGGIPLIAPLTDDLAANRVLELRAIINGTCNYVLTRMASGEAFDVALSAAQQAGYAEADPRDDIDAVDAATSSASWSGLRSTSPARPRSCTARASADWTSATWLTGASSDTC